MLSENHRAFDAHVIRLMNSLPSSDDKISSIERLRQGIVDAFADIDRVSISIVDGADLRGIESSKAGIVLLQSVSNGKAEFRTLDSMLGHTHPLLEAYVMTHGDYTSEWHEPYIMDLATSTDAPIGTIIFWLRKTSSPISSDTIKTVEAIRSFFSSALTHIIVRLQSQGASSTLLRNVFDRIVAKVRLTGKEQKVLLLELLGFEREEIAIKLGIKKSTVDSHIKSIHQKAGVHKYSDYLGLYLRGEFE